MMEFGVSLLGIAQQPKEADMQAAFRDLLVFVHAARDAGFSHVTTGQHFLLDPLQELQPVPLLARLIPETGSMRLISTLVAPLLNPVEVAETWASLDVISGGRIGLSLALGYRDVEYTAFGIPLNRRVRYQQDFVEALLALWSGEPVTMEGLRFGLNEAICTIRPVQDPHPPVWIAANADVAIERAARWGLPWNINSHATHATIARQIELYRSAAAEAGHPPLEGFPKSCELYCGETTQEAIRIAGPYVSAKFDVYSDWGQDKALPGEENFKIPLGDLAEDRFILGSPEVCRQQIQRFADIGINRMHLRMNWPGMPLEHGLRGLKIFAEEVLPHFASAR